MIRFSPGKSTNRKFVTWLTLALFSLQPVLTAAQVVVDPNASAANRPTLDKAQSGTPVVQIAAPSAAGVSHNLYQQFNIDSQGLILNNSYKLSQTQLAGYIQGNPNLKNGSARIILNEVTGTNISQLRGYLEVAGQKADVIIANRNGIVGNGFGFINTSRGVLTTGTPVFGGSGSLEAFRVAGGQIAVEGTGINGEGADRVDLISRAVTANAGIWAKELNVVAGSNQVGYTNLTLQKIESEEEKPQVAIDVSALGGMYANKIKLVGTEHGVGVNSQGNLSASGDLSLTNDGKITLTGNTNAGSNITVTSTDEIDNQGTTYAKGNTNIISAGILTNTGFIGAAQNTAVNAQSVLSTGILAAGFNSDKTISNTGDLTIIATGNIKTSGQAIAGGSLMMTSENIDASGNSTYVGNAASLTATNGNIDNTGGVLQAGGTVTMSATGAITNNQGIIAGDSIHIIVQTNVNNQQGIMQGNSLAMAAQSLDNQNGNILSLGDSPATVTVAQTIQNQGGLIGGNGDLAVTAQAIDNTQSGQVKAGGNLNLNPTQSLNNTDGKLTAKKNVGFNQSSSTINNTRGAIEGENLNFNASSIDNTSGSITATNDINLNTENLSGADGQTTAGRDVNITSNSNFTNGTGSSIKANRDINSNVAGTVTNQGSIIAVRNNISAATHIANHTGATLSAGAKLTAAPTGNITNSGRLDGDVVTFTAQNINNTGTITAGTLTAQANTITNKGDAAIMASTGNMDLTAKTSLENKDGATIYSMGNITIAGSTNRDANGKPIDMIDSVLNQSATIEADKSIAIYGKEITNKKRVETVGQTVVSDVSYGTYLYGRFTWQTGKGDITMVDGFYTDSTPKLNYNGWSDAATLVLGETIVETNFIEDSPEGKIIAGGNIFLNASTINNNNSRIAAIGELNSIGLLNNTSLKPTRATIRHLRDAYKSRPGWMELYNSSCGDYNIRYVDCINTSIFLWHPNRDSGTYDQTTYQDLPATPAIFEGKQAVNIQAPSVNNITKNPTDVPGGNLTTIAPAQPGNQLQTVANDSSLTLPTSSFYTVNKPDSHYLVETDPRFANYGNFITSDYMLQQLNVKPETTMKLVGDGFYQQNLVREQITQLTGRQFLGDNASNQEQYKALLDNGAKYAKQFNLQIGISLSAEQMVQLTSDMVWLVEKEVQGQKVLVPVVYLANSNSGTLQETGSIIRGGNVNINVTQDIINQGGTIEGGQVDLVAGRDIKNDTTSFSANVVNNDFGHNVTTLLGQTAAINTAGNLNIKAGRDISIVGGQVVAGQDIAVNAGRNVEIGTIAATHNSTFARNDYDRTSISAITNLTSTIHAGGNLNVIAAQDANLSGSQMTASKDLTLTAGGNINITAVKNRSMEDKTYIIGNGWQRTRYDNESVIGSNLQGGGAVTVKAVNPASANTGNITLEGSTVTSQNGAVAILADKNIIEKNVTEKHESLVQTHRESSGFFSSSSTDTLDHSVVNQVKGSTVSGDTVNMATGKDINVIASNVAGTNDVSLTAGNNINITSAAETGASEHYIHTQTSGIFSGGGLGFTIGSKSEKTSLNEQTLAQVGSTVGSATGNVNLTAGDKVNVAGSTIISGKDINITAKDVAVNNTINTYDSQYKYEFKQTGLTVSIGGGVATNALNAYNDIKRAGEVEDSRLKALYDYKAADELIKVKDTLKGGLTKANLTKDVGVNISIGSTSNSIEQNTHIETVNLSNVSAGGNVNVKAGQGDINVTGSKISGTDINLDANRDLNVTAAQNRQDTKTNTSSSSWSLGASWSLGDGIFKGLSGSFSSSTGKENEKEITHTGSVVEATDTLTIKSGNDTNITGSKVIGEKVKADVSRELNIASVQDSSYYDANTQSVGIGVSTGQLINGKKEQGDVTGAINNSKTNSTYESVTSQAGIYAGEKGFDINVGKNTDLKAGVISSKAPAVQNAFSTGTLTFSNLENRAQYNASSTGFGVGFKDGKLTGSPNPGMPVSGEASSTTQSAISPGTIIVNGVVVNPENLSRDTDSALNALGKIFDKKTVQEKQELAGLFGEVAFEAIGDLHLKEGSPEKATLDAITGGIISQITGGNFASGASSAGIHQLLANQLANITDDNVRQMVSYVLGAAVSALTGGDPLTGGGITLSEVRNNWLKHGHDRLIEKITDPEIKEILEKSGWNLTDADLENIKKGSAEADSDNASNNALHAMPEVGSISIIEEEFNKNMQHAIDLYNLGERKEATKLLGYAMHTVQDIYSHWARGNDGNWKAHFKLDVVNGIVIPRPDNPDNNPNNFSAAQEATKVVALIFASGKKTGLINDEMRRWIFPK